MRICNGCGARLESGDRCDCGGQAIRASRSARGVSRAYSAGTRVQRTDDRTTTPSERREDYARYAREAQDAFKAARVEELRQRLRAGLGGA